MECQLGNTSNNPLTHVPFYGTFIVVLLWLLGSVAGSTTVPAQVHGDARVEEIRTLYPSEWDVPYPAGLAYARASDQLFLINRGDIGSAQASDKSLPSNRASTAVAVITPYEDMVATLHLPVTLDDPVNMTYDDSQQQLLMLDNDGTKLIRFKVDVQHRPGEMTTFDIAQLALKDAEGMAVDSVAQRLFILDKGALQVVVLDLAREFRLILRVDLKQLGNSDLRGIAVHPLNHNLFIGSPVDAKLYELAAAGWIVNVYDLGPLELVDARAMAFAPSADLTDNPSTIHLYLADSNMPDEAPGEVPVERSSVYGRVLEVALNPQYPSDFCKNEQSGS